MNAKHSFTLKSEEKRRDLPGKIIIGQQGTETIEHVVLKLMAFVIFHRERVQVELNLHRPDIPFTPDIVQLDYEMRVKLWVECGECSLNKLDKLAVKAPEAEIWIVKRSESSARDLLKALQKEELRENRYHILGLDAAMFDEMCGLVAGRNTLHWFKGEFEPPNLQFDFNGLWFDAPFTLLKH